MPVRYAIDNQPGDRLINKIYAWVQFDHKTGLQGLCAIRFAGQQVTAVASSLDIAHKIGDVIESLPNLDKTFRLIEFDKGKVLDEIKKGDSHVC